MNITPLNYLADDPRIDVAIAAEKAHDLAQRNDIAQAIFAVRSNRDVRLLNGYRVETYWSPGVRSYRTAITDWVGCEVFDANGDHIGAEYTGHKDDAAVGHLWAIAKARNLPQCPTRTLSVSAYLPVT